MTRLRARDVRPEPPSDVPEGSVVSIFRVPPEASGMRLDAFLTLQFKRTSRTRAQAIIKASAYDRSGRRMRANDRVVAEQQILLWRPPWDETPVPTDLPVLYEDPWLLAIAKPAGVPVHPTARYHKNTVIKLLEALRPDEWLSLAHRLDRETSGVLLVSRTPQTDRKIKIAFQKRDSIEKRYLAITRGVPDKEAFLVDLPLRLDERSKTKVKMRVADPGTGLFARTRMRVLEARRRGDAHYALVQCDLETGRQHQIRVHLAASGTPIVGDKLYAFDESFFIRDVDGLATDEDNARLELSRHALHAARLAFPHPETGAPIVIESALAPDLRAFWDRLK